MNFPKISVQMNLATRPAIYTPAVNRPKYGLEKDKAYPVDVFGVYQVKVSEDEVDAYFVICLPDGRCLYAGVDTIQFTDMEEHDETNDSD